MDQQQHQFYSIPIDRSNNVVGDSHLFTHRTEDRSAKAASSASSARSPTTVLSVDEMNSIFRMPDEDHGEKGGGGNIDICRHRFLAPPSFATDGELSTFSEETETTEDEEGGTEERRPPFAAVRRRRAPPTSIFRPVGGAKRRRDFWDDDDDDQERATTKLSRGAPPLCRANPIGGDYSSDDGFPSLADSYSFASPFKRVCRGDGGVSSPAAASSSFAPFVAEAQPATIRHSRDESIFPITSQLTGPLRGVPYFKALSSSKATLVFQTGAGGNKDEGN